MCYQGLGRVNGVCQLCNNGYIEPTTEQCVTGCKINEELKGQKCVCKTGFGIDRSGQCSDCSKSAGSFFKEGYCVFCPNGQVVVNNDRCECPAGKTLTNGFCVSSCKEGQLTDANGNCYYCLINEEIKDGKCQCKAGYTKTNSVCQLSCPPNYFVIQESCAMCTLGTVYNPALKQCVCPAGSFMNIQGNCESVAPVCAAGSFAEGSKCVPCPQGCSVCTSLTSCTVCRDDGFYPSGGVCSSRCGDGIRVATE